MMMRHLFAAMALTAAFACRESGRVDAATLEQTPSGPRFRVTVLGDSADSRVRPIREATTHWNDELRRLGRQVRLDSGTVRGKAVPDDVLRAAQGEVVFGRGPATSRLRAQLAGVPGDIVIVMSTTDLISFGLQWSAGSQGVVVLRRADIPPLSLPNTMRNVVAHELGHVLGLQHNTDSTTLMCGRPSPCRPAVFAADTVRFFPLTTADEQWLRQRWP